MLLSHLFVSIFLWCGAAFSCWVVLLSFSWVVLLSLCCFFGVLAPFEWCCWPPPFVGAVLLHFFWVVLLLHFMNDAASLPSSFNFFISVPPRCFLLFLFFVAPLPSWACKKSKIKQVVFAFFPRFLSPVFFLFISSSFVNFFHFSFSFMFHLFSFSRILTSFSCYHLCSFVYSFFQKMIFSFFIFFDFLFIFLFFCIFPFFMFQMFFHFPTHIRTTAFLNLSKPKVSWKNRPNGSRCLQSVCAGARTEVSASQGHYPNFDSPRRQRHLARQQETSVCFG